MDYPVQKVIFNYGILSIIRHCYLKGMPLQQPQEIISMLLVSSENSPSFISIPVYYCRTLVCSCEALEKTIKGRAFLCIFRLRQAQLTPDKIYHFKIENRICPVIGSIEANSVCQSVKFYVP